MQLFELFGNVFLKGNTETQTQLSKIDKIAGGVGKTLGTIGKIGGIAAAAAGTAAVAFGVTAVNAAAKFETGMANIATLLDGDVDKRIAELGDSVQELQRKTGTSAEVLQDGLYQVVSAFGDTADSMLILDTAAQAAAAGQATVTDSVNLLSAVTKGYGDTSAEAAQKASDLAFLTVKLGQTTFPELAASMGAVIPLASAMQVSQEELFGAMATLTGVTGGTSEVTTQLRGTIQGLMKPTKEMQAALEEMGYQTGAAALESLGLQGTLDGLNKVVKGDKTELGNLFGSVEAVNAVLALTGSQAENFTAKTKAMNDASGSTADAFKKTQKTLAATLARGKAVLDTFITDVGTQMLPALTDGLESAIGAITPIFDTLSTAIADADGDMSKIGEAVGNALGDVIDLLTANLPKMIEGGMALVSALLEGIITNLPAIGEAAVTLLLQLVQMILANLPRLIEVAFEILMTLVNGIITAIPTLIPQVVRVVLAIIDTIMANLSGLLTAAIEIILALALGIIDALPMLMEKAPIILGQLIAAIIENLPVLLDAALQIILALAAGLIVAIPQLIANIPVIIQSLGDAFLNTDWGSIGGDILGGIGKGIMDGAGRLADQAVAAAERAFNDVKNFLGINSPSKKFNKGIGRGIPEGIAQGVIDAGDQIPRAIKRVTPLPEDLPKYPEPVLGPWSAPAATPARPRSTSTGSTQNPATRNVAISGKIEVMVKSMDDLYEKVYDFVIEKVQTEVLQTA